MKTNIANIYEKLRSSYWFIPSYMAIQAMILASLLIALDQLNEQQALINLSLITLTGAAGARTILSTVASSMITVTGIVFSTTIVTLSLVSRQLGPRLLQNFMRDRGKQYVLGTVTSTYLYCLLVLRAVSEDHGSRFVPHLSILVALLLAILCVGVLIYFILHVAESIQVTNVIAAVSRELAAGIERLFPEKICDAAFNQIRQYGRAYAAVAIRLQENIRVVIPFTRYPQHREAQLRQAAMIKRGSHEGLPEEADHRDVHEKYLAIFQTMEECFGLTGEA